jgi:tagaturonate reductase
MMQDETFAQFINRGIYEEIIPTISDRVQPSELEEFAASVADRFANPFIKHYLSSISLNSVAKFAARVLPTIIEYHEKNSNLPPLLTFSFAALLHLYRGDSAQDDAEIIAFLRTKSVQKICENENFWHANLANIPGFVAQTEAHLSQIEKIGTKAAIRTLLKSVSESSINA